jgi:hypothetical protein
LKLGKFFSSTAELVTDFTESLLLFLCYIASFPLMILMSYESIGRGTRYVRFLLPEGFLAAFARAQLDAKFGNYERSAIIVNHIATQFEKTAKSKTKDKAFRAAMLDLYNFLLQLYFLGGHIEGASQVVVRAREFLGVAYLPQYPDFDFRTAQIVKAGIAAGRLLEDGGLATLFVKQGETPVVTGATRKNQPAAPKKPRPAVHKTSRMNAKIIPFPHPPSS